MTLYDTLGVEPAADTPAIKRAYRKAAKRAHPDAGGSAEAFGDLNRALQVLSDPISRARYDRTGDASEPSPDNGNAMAVSLIVGFFAVAAGLAASAPLAQVDQQIKVHTDAIALLAQYSFQFDQPATFAYVTPWGPTRASSP